MFTKALLMALMMGVTMAQDYESELMDSEARFLYFNSSSTATSLTLLGAVILLGVIFYLVYVGGLLSPAASSGYAYNRNDYQYNQYDQYNHARSASDGFEMNGMNVLQWISMLQEVYEKFDYNDLECQKKLICEVMQEKEQFGSVSRNLKTGFEFAKYLEVLNMPDDFREILDEYMDASERSTGQKECHEVFQCPYSLKDSMKRNFSGNSL
jgi:hypothetical protein